MTTVATGFNTNPILEMLYLQSEQWTVAPKYLDGRHAILLNEVTFTDSIGHVHRAFPGLITDGGSVPRFFWRVIGSPFTFCLIAYLIHDEECQEARDIGGPLGQKMRERADITFVEMLEWIDANIERINVDWWKRRVMYRGVRVGAVIGHAERNPKEGVVE